MTLQSLKTAAIDRRQLAHLSHHLAAIGFTEDGIREAVSGAPSPDPWSFASQDLPADGSPLSVVLRVDRLSQCGDETQQHYPAKPCLKPEGVVHRAIVSAGRHGA